MNLAEMMQTVDKWRSTTRCCDDASNVRGAGNWIPIDCRTALYAMHYASGFRYRRGMYCFVCGMYSNRQEYARER